MNHKNIRVAPSLEEILASKNIKLTKKLGEGSYAKVYLAEVKGTENSKEKLACKVIDAAKAPRDFVRKFLPRELQILLKINHPHIVHIHSIFQRRTKYFIMMRFAECGDMLQFVQNYGPLTENQARVWIRQLALAIQYLHEMDIAHRDLKCENVLITQNKNVKLSDFGFSRLCIDAKGFPVRSNTYCGSISYVAPEVLRGIPYLPKISDIWSLGVLFYVLLNKSMPFDDTNVKKLYDHQMKKRWKFRTKVTGVLSDKSKSLIRSMMEPDTVKRFSIEQIVNSEWIAMDPRLTVLTPMERSALLKAKESTIFLEPMDTFVFTKNSVQISNYSEESAKGGDESNTRNALLSDNNDTKLVKSKISEKCSNRLEEF